MVKEITRRSLLKGTASVAAGAAAAGVLGKASRAFAAPAVISQTGSNVTVNYWTAWSSGVNGDAQVAVINDFQAANPGITIKSTPYASYEDLANALVAGLQVGDVPDAVVLSDVWWFTFYALQAITDLNTLITADTKTDDYVQSLFIEYQRHGGQWAIPFARSTPLFYYNKTALEKAGLTTDIFGKWSDFKSNAQTFINGGGIKAAMSFGNAASYGAWVLQGPVWAFNGKYSDPDFTIRIAEPEAVACGEFFRDFVHSGLAVTADDPAPDFNAGVAGAILASTGSIGSTKAAVGDTFEWGTSELPSELKFGCCTGGAGISILNKASDDVKAAAFKFIEFSTSTETTTKWSQTTGYMPVRTSAIKSDDEQAFLKANPNNAVAIGQLPKTQPQDSARVFIPGGDEIIGRGWENVLVNNTPAQDAFNEVKSNLDSAKVQILEQIKAIEG